METRDALSELADRARSIVDELARNSRGWAQAAGERLAPAAAGDRSGADWTDSPSSAAASERAPLPDLHRRLDELRACVGEVGDVLEATVERLETVERQLGDPDSAVERQLSEGIERCERVLMGIEHRAWTENSQTARPAAVSVLVVAASSRRRAGLCVALEHQGVRTLAAADTASALRITSRAAPQAALLVLGGPPETCADMLDEWNEYHARGSLPPAVVLEGGQDERPAGIDPARFGFDAIREDHGTAAMAASLARVARAVRQAGGNDG